VSERPDSPPKRASAAWRRRTASYGSQWRYYVLPQLFREVGVRPPTEVIARVHRRTQTPLGDRTDLPCPVRAGEPLTGLFGELGYCLRPVEEHAARSATVLMLSSTDDVRGRPPQLTTSPHRPRSPVCHGRIDPGENDLLCGRYGEAHPNKGGPSTCQLSRDGLE
jgi:hypothetical protein